MSTNLRDLPEEVIGYILGYAPEMVAPLRLVEFDLANAAWPAYIDHYIRVARIVPDTIDTSMRSLLHFAENDDTDVTHNIQELSIHSYAVSLVGDQDGIDDDDKLANNIIRIYTHLRHIIPALRNCRRVSFSPKYHSHRTVS
jgi:hypothetical protein